MAKAKPKGIVFKDKHLTKQDHGGMADINTIAQMYMSGRLPYPDVPPGFYGDISTVDVAEARNILAAVNTAFEELPSDVRDHFENDPMGYVDFLDKNECEIGELGIARVLRDHVHPQVEEVVSSETTKSAQGEDEPAPEQHS